MGAAAKAEAQAQAAAVPNSSNVLAVSTELYPSEEDFLYEEEVLRNPYTLKVWWRYLQARREAPFKKRAVLFERALKALPGSYKLWYAYLRERMEAVRGLPPTHPQYQALSNTFERALVTMHKMPRIWTLYLQILVDQKLLTKTRRTFDRALCSLPVTQHDRLWEPYLSFVSQQGVPIETSLRVYRRYLKFDPNHVEDFIRFLISAKRWQEAAEMLAQVLNDETFHSVNGKTRHELWLELCNILTTHAQDVSGLPVDPIIRGGIRKFTDEVGRLWTALGDYYIRKGFFEKARDVYEEGMMTVVTVRDFTVIFDAYTQFEESMLAAKMETLDVGDEMEEQQVGGAQQGKGRDTDSKDGSVQNGADRASPKGARVGLKDHFQRWERELLANFWLKDFYDIDLRLARLEHLMARRPELVSSVLLRQNPHNVHEWHKRAKLFKDNPAKQILTFTEAVKTVDPLKAVGKPHTLWMAFAHLYEAHKDLKNVRVIFDKAVQVNYKAADDLASIWCDWAETELRHKNFKGALELMQRATAEPNVAVKRRVAADGQEPVQMKLFRSLKLWMFYVDLEESLGTLESTRAVYERILDLRIATPQIIINYALLLEEHKYFEDAFRVYERGVQIFKYPHARDIWVSYLSKFVKRYGGKKLERARDLFEQALEKVPAEDAKPLYLQYAKLEEDHGLARHAMSVYDRAIKAIPDNEKMSIYEIYISRAAEFLGVPKTRDIYEQAIESGLPDKDVKTMCLKYAELEQNLGEIDRARAIFVHASQMADPRSDADFWSKWNDFEVAHGNEDTFREMRRIKRSVTASYSQMHFILPEYLMQGDQGKSTREETVDTLKRAGVPEDEMAVLERQIGSAGNQRRPGEGTRVMGFVSSGIEIAGEAAKQPKLTANPDEITLPDESEEEEEGEEPKVDVTQKPVPDAVYGELAPMGALERLKRQRLQ